MRTIEALLDILSPAHAAKRDWQNWPEAAMSGQK
jgi:hypothetical protein